MGTLRDEAQSGSSPTTKLSRATQTHADPASPKYAWLSNRGLTPGLPEPTHSQESRLPGHRRRQGPLQCVQEMPMAVTYWFPSLPLGLELLPIGHSASLPLGLQAQAPTFPGLTTLKEEGQDYSHNCLAQERFSQRPFRRHWHWEPLLRQLSPQPTSFLRVSPPHSCHTPSACFETGNFWWRVFVMCFIIHKL